MTPALGRVGRLTAGTWLLFSSLAFVHPPAGLLPEPHARLVFFWGLERLVTITALAAVVRLSRENDRTEASPLAFAIRWSALLCIATRIAPVLLVGFQGHLLEVAHRFAQALALGFLVDGPIGPRPEPASRLSR